VCACVCVCVCVQVNRPITMKKEGIQTRNRKMTATKTRRTTSLTRHAASSVVDAMSSRRLFSLRHGATPFYDRPPYYQPPPPAPATTGVFPGQPALSAPETGFYAAQAGGAHGYSDYGEGYQMAAADAGVGYTAAVVAASSQQYLSVAAAGFHRHLHHLL